MSEPCSQRELARRLGLSQSAVSLALRGDATIPPATRERVREAARAAGYLPHPYAGALMRQVRSGGRVRQAGCLAIVADAADASAWLTHPAYRQQAGAIFRRAALRGFRPEVFYLRAPGMSPARLDRVLEARGIGALILAAPRREGGAPLAIRWERYACVTSGYTWSEPGVDRITPHHRHHVELAFRRLCELGYRRIGFCLPASAQPRVDESWLCGWLLCQHHLSARRRIPCYPGSPWDSAAADFARWLRRWRPDALLSLRGNELPWLRTLGLKPGRDLAFATLFPPEDPTISHVDENNPLIGELVCDLLLAHLLHNERGLPPHPRCTTVEGDWVERQSTPPASQLRPQPA